MRYIFILFLFSTIHVFADDKLKELSNKLEAEKSDTAKVWILNELADVYANNNYPKAIEYASKANALALKNNFARGISYTLFQLGVINLNFNKYEETTRWLLQALRAAEKYNHNYIQGRAYTSLGNVYGMQFNNKMALYYFSKASEIFEKLGDRRRLGVVINNIGNLYYYSDYKKKDFSKTLFYYNKARQIHESGKHKKELVTTLHNLGNVYTDQENFKEALNVLNRSLEISRAMANKADEAFALTNLGRAYGSMKNEEKALEVLFESLKISKAIDNKGMLVTNYFVITEVYVNKNDFKKAYQYQKLYSDLKDSVLNTESSKQIAEMQTQFDTENKEKQIQLLEKEKNINELEVNRQKTVSWSLSGAVILVLIAGASVFSRYQDKRKANLLLEQQNVLIEQKNKNITDSINYAKKIQQAMLPSVESVKKLFPESFILFKPKDIVSGDFYFFNKINFDGNEVIVFAVADCTGHGVPGSLMSMICIENLHDAVKETCYPGEILSKVNQSIKTALSQSTEHDARDGMDITLCAYFPAENKLMYSGANRALWIIKESGDLIEHKPDKSAIGGFTPFDFKFETKQISIDKGDQLYLTSDGYADQFGGKSGKKMMVKNFKNLLLESRSLQLHEQENLLSEKFESWQNDHEQVDDVLVIGIKI